MAEASTTGIFARPVPLGRPGSSILGNPTGVGSRRSVRVLCGTAILGGIEGGQGHPSPAETLNVACAGSTPKATPNEPVGDASETRRRPNTVAAHHRTRSGEPVQTGCKRGQRWNGGQQCRASHVPPKPYRRLIPPAPLSTDGRISSAVEQINLTTCVSSRCFASLARAALHASVSRREEYCGVRPRLVSSQSAGTQEAYAGPRPPQGASGTGPSPRSGPEALITNADGDGAPVSRDDQPWPTTRPKGRPRRGWRGGRGVSACARP